MMELVRKLPYDHPYRWDGTEFGYQKLWQPDELQSLVLWLDAEDTSSLVFNGSTVSQWYDKSGTGNHVSNATASTQPTYLATSYNGKPTIYVKETSGDFLFKSNVINFSAQNDFTIASAFEFLAPNKFLDMIVGWRSIANDPANGNGSPILMSMYTDLQIGYYDTGTTDTRIKVDVTSRLGKKIATISRSGGTNGNGGAATATSTGFSQATYQTNATQTWNSDNASGLQIGGRQQVNTECGNKYISEVVCYNTKLSTIDRQKLEGYMAWKWGLEAELPASHPFKLFPPTV